MHRSKMHVAEGEKYTGAKSLREITIMAANAAGGELEVFGEVAQRER